MKPSSKFGCFRSVGAVGAIAGTLLFAAAGSAAAFPGWNYVSSEGGGFYASETGELVRYGDYTFSSCTGCLGKWTYKWVKGPIVTCTNQTFGKDPYWARVKRCETYAWGNLNVLAGEGDDLPASLPVGAIGYGQFHADGDNSMVDEAFSWHQNPGKCDNTTFAAYRLDDPSPWEDPEDPYPGMLKICFVYQ